MKHVILAAATALALTGPVAADPLDDFKLGVFKCVSIFSSATHEADTILRLKLEKSSLQRARTTIKDPSLERTIRETEENIRAARAAAAEYSTIYRNLCKD